MHGISSSTEMTNMAAFLTACVLLLLIHAFPNAEGACMNTVNCHAYSTQYICRDFVEWSKRHCPKFCGFCNGSSGCPSGWKFSWSDGTCLKMIGARDATARKTWYDAHAFCVKNGGNLVTIKDKDKNVFVDEIQEKREFYIWIGIKNVDKKGTSDFKYVDGFPLVSNKENPTSYNNWKYDQPDNYEDKEHCVVILPSGKWSDVNCLVERPFICQTN